MRYLTKEWYDAMQKTSLHLRLKTSKEAATCSEEYYQRLYAEMIDERLPLMERRAKTKVQSATRPGVVSLSFDYDENAFFDKEGAIDKIQKNHLAKVESWRRELPSEILQRVADIRVLALGYATEEVKGEIAAYCQQNKQKEDEGAAAYREHFEKEFGENAPAFWSEFNLHDCAIRTSRWEGRDLFLDIDSSCGCEKCANVFVLKNCSVLRQEAPIDGMVCFYTELYKRDDGYEINLLLYKDGKLCEFDVAVSDVEYK